MEKEFYTCQFCQEKYKPKRRGVQKFCSSTCRTKNYYHNLEKENANGSFNENESKENEKSKKDELSWAGVGNAALGVLIIEMLTKLLTKVENKSATKGDIEALKKVIATRYLPAINVTSDPLGRKAYYDTEFGKIVFYNEQQERFELPMMDL